MSPLTRRAALQTLGLALGASVAPRAFALAPERSPIELTRMSVRSSGVTAPARTGETAELTLDPRLELAANQLLHQARPVEGAIVALDPRTGKILVWSELRQPGASDSVVTAARAPAASVFKVVTTAALFEAGGLTPNERVCISGGIRAIERKHLEVPREGDVTCGPFSDALGHSRNAVFAQLATRRLLRDDLLSIAERVGFNAEIPFDWGVPLGHLTVPYNDLAFARTAAGFQGSTLSPLGGAYLASIVATGGLSYRLKLIARAGDYEASPEPELVGRILGSTTAWRMTRMMEVTIHSGTCRSVFTDEKGRSLLPGVRVAGKTGTLRPETREGMTSWFIGFAPSRRPEIVVSVMLQNGPVWRKRAAEVGRDVLRAYFRAAGVRGVDDPFMTVNAR